MLVKNYQRARVYRDLSQPRPVQLQCRNIICLSATLHADRRRNMLPTALLRRTTPTTTPHSHLYLCSTTTTLTHQSFYGGRRLLTSSSSRLFSSRTASNHPSTRVVAVTARPSSSSSVATARIGPCPRDPSRQHRQFSSSPATMTGQKIDGNAIAKSIREGLNAEIKKTQEVNPRYKPTLRIIQGM